VSAVSHDVRPTTIVASDGVRLVLHATGPSAGTPVLLVPGTFSNHTFWLGTRGTGLARDLAEHGYATWTLDPRGHGHSERPGAGARWRFDDWARRDAVAAIDAAFGERPGFIVGHSAGGAAALVALAANPDLHDRVRGIVLVGTPVPWLQPFSRTGAHVIRTLSFMLRRFPARALGLGPEDEVAGVMTQWMTWNLNGRWIGDDGTDYSKALTELSVPMLVVAAAADRWAPPPSCRALLDLVASRDLTWQLCGRSTGFSRDFGHVDVLVGRAARTEVWPLLRAWLAERHPPRAV
jgi:pimeloyl-ACP methyl ester carboxylesterase